MQNQTKSPDTILDGEKLPEEVTAGEYGGAGISTER